MSNREHTRADTYPQSMDISHPTNGHGRPRYKEKPASPTAPNYPGHQNGAGRRANRPHEKKNTRILEISNVSNLQSGFPLFSGRRVLLGLQHHFALYFVTHLRSHVRPREKCQEGVLRGQGIPAETGCQMRDRLTLRVAHQRTEWQGPLQRIQGILGLIRVNW